MKVRRKRIDQDKDREESKLATTIKKVYNGFNEHLNSIDNGKNCMVGRQITFLNSISNEKRSDWPIQTINQRKNKKRSQKLRRLLLSLCIHHGKPNVNNKR